MVDTAVTALRERGYDAQTADMIARLADMPLCAAVGHWITQPVEKKRLAAYLRAARSRATRKPESSV